MKIKKRYLLLTPILLLLGALPSKALSWQQLIPLLNQVQDLKNEFVSLYENFDERLMAVIEEYTGDIEISLGDLGLPDIGELEKQLEEELEGLGTINAPEVVQEEERNIVRAKSMGTLSEQGQAQQKQKMDELGSNATTTMTRGLTAQARITTQSVMKDIALQNSEISSSLSLMGSEIMDMSQKQDLTNLSLTNISEGIDSQNLLTKHELDGSTKSILTLSGLASGGFYDSTVEDE